MKFILMMMLCLLAEASEDAQGGKSPKKMVSRAARAPASSEMSSTTHRTIDSQGNLLAVNKDVSSAILRKADAPSTLSAVRAHDHATTAGSYEGTADWTQQCSSQSHADQEQAMDTACSTSYPGSRAATIDEVVGGSIQNMPATSGTRHMVLKCGSTTDAQCHGTYSGNSRQCLNPGSSFPTAYAPSGAWNPNCCGATRSTLCITGGVTASGDPHAANLKGERFDIFATGELPLVWIPRGAKDSDALLTVTGDIRHSGGTCAPTTFIQQLHVTGMWLGDSKKVDFRAGSPQGMEPFGMAIGDAPFKPHPALVEETSRRNRTLVVSKGILEHGPLHGSDVTARAWTVRGDGSFMELALHGLSITVKQREGYEPFLDVDVKGLRHVNAEVGGLLGLDDHSDAARQPVDCKEQGKTGGEVGTSNLVQVSSLKVSTVMAAY